MKTTIKSLLIGGSLLTATSAFAEIETEFYTGYHSIYEFRGVDLGDDLVDVGLDLNYELAEGLSLNGGAWYASWDAGGADDELDLYIGLTKTLGAVDLSVGYTYYMFPGDSDANTEEVFLGVSTELDCGLGLALTYYEDIDQISGGYMEFEAAKSFELSESIVVDVAAGAAWCDDYGLNLDVDGSNMDGFNHWYISASLPIEIKEDVSLTPYIKYVDASSDLDSSLVDAGAESDDHFYAGVSLSVAF
ncbi:MAG: TorF family putative porin [Akkermansiaceae bacterium]